MHDDFDDQPDDNESAEPQRDANGDIPEVLLLDPQRLDLKTPPDILIAREQSQPPEDNMKTKSHPGDTTADGAASLPPLTGDGMSQIELHDKQPLPDKPSMLRYDGPERRAHLRSEHEQRWSVQVREGNAVRALELRSAERGDNKLWSDEQRIANALATSEYIAHAGDATTDALNQDANTDSEQIMTGFDGDGAHYGPAHTPSRLLSNPMRYIDQLEPLAPGAAFLARNGICASLGYSVISAIRWELINARQPRSPEVDDDDLFDQHRALFDQNSRVEEQGFVVLPEFKAASFAGVFTQLLYDQRAQPQFNGRWPVMRETEILTALQSGSANQQQMAEVYSRIMLDLLGEDNPALPAILASRSQIHDERSEADQLAHAAEKAYVLDALKHAIPSVLDDAAWDAIPLYMQYRYSTMVHKRLIKLIGSEMNAREPDLIRFEKLGAIARDMTLEIEAAFASAEVQAAFEQKRLDSRHDIRAKLPPAKNAAPKAPVMHRAPPPPPAPAPTFNISDADPDDELP